MLAKGIRSLSTPIKVCVRNKATGIKILSVSNDLLPYKGKVATNKSVKVELKAGLSYSWCSCGLSTQQPFCDGSHRATGVTDVKPITFQVEKSGSYRLCNCKQTDSRPLCDGKHKAVDPTPAHAESSRMVAFGDSSSAVYNGVAHKLGYKPKNGGFQ
ncbi:unnamed protein product [Auanema sp. JU1783]|nr:unnamed protein product [Auanema sp. JU1783]